MVLICALYTAFSGGRIVLNVQLSASSPRHLKMNYPSVDEQSLPNTSQQGQGSVYK